MCVTVQIGARRLGHALGLGDNLEAVIEATDQRRQYAACMQQKADSAGVEFQSI